MHNDERFFSRGNTAIAALVMVTLVGGAALIFDSTQSTPSQLAQAPTATTPTPVPVDRGVCNLFDGQLICQNDQQKCTLGYDYLVKMEDVKDPKTGVTTKVGLTYATKDDKTPRIFGPKGTQCPSVPATATVPAHTPPTKVAPRPPEIGERTCTATGWKCYVTFCKPKGFSGAALSQEECITITPPVGINQPMKIQETVDSNLKGLVTNAILNGTPEEQKVATEYTPALSSPVQDSIRNSLNEKIELSEGTLEQYKIETADLEKKIQALGCTPDPDADYGPECNKLTRDLMANQDMHDEELIRKEALAAQAKSLGDVSTGGLKPAGTPARTDCLDARDCAQKVYYAPGDSTFGYKCPGGPGCPGGEWDPKKGMLVDNTGVDCRKPEFRTHSLCTSDTRSNEAEKNRQSSQGSGLNLGQYMPLLAGLMQGFLQKEPSCTLTASPPSITQVGQPVTLSWRTENARSASLSNVGQVGLR